VNDCLMDSYSDLASIVVKSPEPSDVLRAVAPAGSSAWLHKRNQGNREQLMTLGRKPEMRLFARSPLVPLLAIFINSKK